MHQRPALSGRARPPFRRALCRVAWAKLRFARGRSCQRHGQSSVGVPLAARPPVIAQYRDAMPPDVQQLHRISALAARGGLSLRPVDADAFVAAYVPHRYRQFELPPSFIWLCTICDPDQLARIWINVAAAGDLGALHKLNDDTRSELVPWPDELIQFALTGDESLCFGYNTTDTEPAVVIVDSYYPCREDENGQEYVNWSWFADDFERWLAFQADWLPEADAKLRAWHAQFKARKKAEARSRPNSRATRNRSEPHRKPGKRAPRRND